MRQVLIRWRPTASGDTLYQLSLRGQLQSVNLTSSRFTVLRGKTWLSQRLARRLGLIQYGVDYHLDMI